MNTLSIWVGGAADGRATISQTTGTTYYYYYYAQAHLGTHGGGGGTRVYRARVLHLDRPQLPSIRDHTSPKRPKLSHEVMNAQGAP